jgi:hypothetical protein
MSANSFAKLFRKSSFARYDPSMLRVYKAPGCPPPSVPLTAQQQNHPTVRPEHFGFKRDMPSSYHGGPLKTLSITRLDGDFGQPVIREESMTEHAFHVVTEARQAMEAEKRIPARFLNQLRADGGFAMGIAGVVAWIGAADLPEGFKVTVSDINSRRAYWVYVKEATIDDKGRPLIRLSFRKPLAPKFE